MKVQTSIPTSGAFALLYSRVSVDRSAQGQSIERHSSQGRERAGLLWPGLPLVELLDNDTSSSVPLDARPSGRKLIKALETGRAVGLVVMDQDRLARDLTDWDQLVKLALAKGIMQLHREDGQTIDLVDRMPADLKAVMDAQYRREAAKRATARHRFARENGKPVGPAPYGFDHEGPAGRRVRVANPVQAAVVARMLDELLADQTLTAVAEGLNAEGITTGRGAQWTPSSVRQTVSNPAVIGRRCHREGTTSQRWVDDGPGEWEPIVDPTAWRKVMAHLDGKPGRRGRTERDFVLSGVLVCDDGRHAGELAPMRGTRVYRGATSVPYYRCASAGCARAVMAEELEPFVIGLVARYVADQVARGLTDTAVERKAAQDALAAAKARRDHLAARFTSMDPTEYELLAGPVRDQLRAAERRVADVTGDQAGLPALQVTMRSWEAQPLGIKRQALKTVLDSVVVGPSVAAGHRVATFDRLQLRWR